MVDDGCQNGRYCLGCSYILQGLGRNQCPECGRSFDPQDPRTTSAHPVGDARILLARAGRILTFFLAIVAGAAMLLSAGGFDPVLRWLAGILLAPLVIVLLTAALIPSVPLSFRRRTAGIACAALLVSVVVTDWPFRVMFELHRSALERTVSRFRSGEFAPHAGPVRVGLFSFRRVVMATNGNLGFQLTGGPGGGVYLVHAQGGTWIWYNTNWEQNLRGGWFRAYED
jgi:hypothetical protein